MKSLGARLIAKGRKRGTANICQDYGMTMKRPPLGFGIFFSFLFALQMDVWWICLD